MHVFFSSKNIISLENEKMIKKIFHQELDFYTELNFYQQFADSLSCIPKLIKEEPQILYLEYLNGRSVYDIELEQQIQIGKTLAQFHNQTYNEQTGLALIHYDTNLNNYLWFNHQIYLFDFSEITLDLPLCDVYSVSLFFAELLPAAIFKHFINSLYQIYQQNIQFQFLPALHVFQKERQRFENRREFLRKSIHHYQDYLNNVQIIGQLAH